MKILEYNSIRKDLRNKIKIALCIPSIYRVGMSSLALHTIYSILNSYEDVACERVFLPTRNSPPYTLESNQPIKNFDFIAFSLHFEMNYSNVIKILLNSNIPIYSKDRNSDYPIIIAGGPICANPLPLSQFIDLFVIGDFEPISGKILDIYRESSSKGEFFESCSELPGFYIPKYMNKKVKKVYEQKLDNCPHPLAQIIPEVKINSPFFPSLGKSFLLEVCRGCNRGCHFCLIGYQGRPVRFRSLNKIKEIIDEGIEKTQVNKVSIIGSGLSDHPNLSDICQYIVHKGLELSIPSIRLDRVSDELLEVFLRANQNTLTLAPETATNRLLEVINKGFSRESILTSIEKIKHYKIRNLKLYFMINLPTETEADLISIGDLIQKINRIGYGGSNLKLSVNNFIPKPHTPFQWESNFNLEELRRKIKFLKRLIKTKIDLMDPRWAKIQTHLSLGDENMGTIIELATRYGSGLGSWNKAFKNARFLSCVYDIDSRLPWDFIEFEFDKNKLRKIYEKIFK
ncbi:MAG: radical SAM protein [Candidatus Helarchaeota archaeon]